MNRLKKINPDLGLLQRLIPFFIILLLFLSNKHLSWQEGINYLQANDVTSYTAISEAAPSFPQQKLLYHHSQRFFFPYLTGFFKHISNIKIEILYRFFCYFAILLTSIIFWKILLKINSSLLINSILYSLLILNPYAFRYYFIIPGLVTDVYFLLGMVIIFYGIQRNLTPLVMIGAIIAALARQTVILLIPGIIIFYILKEYPLKTSKKNIFITFSICLLIILLYISTGILGSQFSTKSGNIDHFLGLFSFLINEFSFPVLIEHTLRTILPFAPILAIGAGLLVPIIIKRKTKIRKLYIYFPYIFSTILITIQPFLGGPYISGRNTSRLAALGLIPLILCMAEFIKANEKIFTKNINLCYVLICISLLFISSFHHMYTIVYWRKTEFFVLASFLISLFLFFYTFFIVKKSVSFD